MKIEKVNYLIWKELLKNVIKVCGLHSLVDGLTFIPSRLIKKQITSDNDDVYEVLVVNRDYG